MGPINCAPNPYDYELGPNFMWAELTWTEMVLGRVVSNSVE